MVNNEAMKQRFNDIVKAFYESAYENVLMKTENFADFYDWYLHCFTKSLKLSDGLEPHKTFLAVVMTHLMVKAYVQTRQKQGDNPAYYTFRTEFLNALSDGVLEQSKRANLFPSNPDEVESFIRRHGVVSP